MPVAVLPWFCVLLLATSHAPARAGEKDAQLWIRTSASAALPDGWEIGLKSVLRFGHEAGGLYEGEFGGSIGRALGGGVSASAGYLRVPRYGRGAARGEDRLRQQLSFPIGRAAGGRLDGRLRIEQRLPGGGAEPGVRLRPFLAWRAPVGRAGTALLFSHESFVNLNDTDWGQSGGWERMRNFAGLATPLAGGIVLEAGYLNQYGQRRGRPDRQDHVGSLGLSYRF